MVEDSKKKHINRKTEGSVSNSASGRPISVEIRGSHEKERKQKKRVLQKPSLLKDPKKTRRRDGRSNKPLIKKKGKIISNLSERKTPTEYTTMTQKKKK